MCLCIRGGGGRRAQAAGRGALLSAWQRRACLYPSISSLVYQSISSLLYVSVYVSAVSSLQYVCRDLSLSASAKGALGTYSIGCMPCMHLCERRSRHVLYRHSAIGTYSIAIAPCIRYPYARGALGTYSRHVLWACIPLP
jgi:hypothetical protein